MAFIGRSAPRHIARSPIRPPGLGAHRAIRRALLSDAPIPYLRENATHGMARPHSGRGFGVELEFDFPDHFEQSSARQTLAESLFERGYLEQPKQSGYHSTRNASAWRFEVDGSVDGEVISPILHDRKQHWSELEDIVATIKKHGGTSNTSTGGHVHVGIGDYGPSVRPHANLLRLVHAFMQDLHILAIHPERGAHRGTMYARPNVPYPGEYETLAQVVGQNRGDKTINFLEVDGSPKSHVEFRLWDGVLDPAVIQVQVKLSLALVELAKRPVKVEKLLARAARVTDERKRITLLFDALFTRRQDLRQVARLYARIHRARQANEANQPA